MHSQHQQSKRSLPLVVQPRFYKFQKETYKSFIDLIEGED